MYKNKYRGGSGAQRASGACVLQPRRARRARERANPNPSWQIRHHHTSTTAAAALCRHPFLPCKRRATPTVALDTTIWSCDTLSTKPSTRARTRDPSPRIDYHCRLASIETSQPRTQTNDTQHITPSMNSRRRRRGWLVTRVKGAIEEVVVGGERVASGEEDLRGVCGDCACESATELAKLA